MGVTKRRKDWGREKLGNSRRKHMVAEPSRAEIPIREQCCTSWEAVKVTSGLRLSVAASPLFYCVLCREFKGINSIFQTQIRLWDGFLPFLDLFESRNQVPMHSTPAGVWVQPVVL